MDLWWWVDWFREGTKWGVKESECLQDDASFPQLCLVLHGWLCRQQWGLQHSYQVSVIFCCRRYTPMVGAECVHSAKLFFRLGRGISAIKWSWSRDVTTRLTTIDCFNTQGGAESGYVLIAAGDCRRPGRAAGSLKERAA